MSIPKLLKHYKLNPTKLKVILKRNNFNDNIRLIKHIPEEWVSVLSMETGIKDYEVSEKKHSGISISKKGKVLKTKLNSLSELQVISKQKQSKNQFHIAYVKYIAPDFSHSYLKIIDDIHSVNYNMLRENTDKDYKIYDNCDEIEIGQFVIVSIKGSGFKKCKIQEQLFTGIIITEPLKRFTDWISFNNPIKLDSNIRFTDDFENFEISKVKLFFDRRVIRCQKSKTQPDFNKIIDRISLPFTEAIAKKIIAAEDVFIINSFKYNTSEYFELCEKQFQYDINNKDTLKDKINIENFFVKWQKIYPEILVLSKVKNLEYLNFYVRLWLDEKIDDNFWESHLIDALINFELNEQEKDDGDDSSCVNVFNEVQIKEISTAINVYFQKELIIEDLNTYNVLEGLVNISTSNSKNQHLKQLQSSLIPELAFDLWIQDEQLKFPKEKGIATFKQHEIEIQERVLNELSDDEIAPLIPSIKGISNKTLEKRICSVINETISSKINFICFDIESNGKEIVEFGWVNNENKEECFQRKIEVEKGVDVFKELTNIENNIFVGHNIIEWDLPILSKFEVTIPKNQIWDTLLVETLLSPEFKNYALITAHNAVDDAKLTRQLFLNQLNRILLMEEQKLTPLFSYLSSNIVEKIKELKTNNKYIWNPVDLFNSEKKMFFRPQPQENHLIQKVKSKIDAIKANNIVVIGHESLKKEALSIANIKLHCTDASSKDLYKLNNEKINQISDIHIWEKQVLLNYINHYTSLNQPIFWGQLPTIVRIKIENNIDNILDFFCPNEEIEWSDKNVMFFTIPELLLYQDQLAQLKDISVITIHNDLLSVENKKVLKEVSLDFLMSEIKNDDHIWLKFSGGQSFSELTTKQCEALEVKVPALFDNLWIEKVTLNKFKIWGNFNWENLILNFDIINIEDIQPDDATFKKEQSIIAQVSAAETLKSKVIRFNPESLYRSRYWVFQKQLIDQIVNQEQASVLLIQKYDEIEVLENYFRHFGYYIPQKDISIGRRLELLHQSKSTFRLIIEHTTQLERIMQANHVDSVNVIFDSFNISENYFSVLNSSYFKNLNSSRLKKIVDVEEDDLDNMTTKNEVLNPSKKPIISDVFLLLELLKPKISHIRNLLQYEDPQHKLWILDPRCNDYNSIYKSWNVCKRTLKVWNSFEAYEEAVKEADMHIDSVNPMEDLPIDLERIKVILQQVFLKDFDWRPSQIPYLDLIIEGKEDQLITLPTGEGKSVLFQGPALFKSAFTNRLTIVITPLKALMEDQVNALWDKGFFGSVEYINSDRSSEVYSIYRAMAGGELSLLFVTPERFRSRSFNNALQLRIQSDGGLEYGVFDEAHCVSQWGHEFRPDYFNCAKRMANLKKLSSNNFPLLLFSATVSEKIYKDFNTIFSC